MQPKPKNGLKYDHK